MFTELEKQFIKAPSETKAVEEVKAQVDALEATVQAIDDRVTVIEQAP